MTHHNIPAYARRYAGAYVDLLAKKDLNTARQEVKDYLEIIHQSNDLRALIENPLFSPAQKKDVLTQIHSKAKLSDQLNKLILIVLDNNRINSLPEILQAIRNEIAKRLGEIDATVESAFELNKTQIGELEKEISRISGGKANMNVTINPQLIGGLVITVGSQRIDGSIKRRLELLARQMRTGANENNTELKRA